MKLKDYWNLLIGKTDAERPARFRWSNIKAVFQALFRRAREISGFHVEQHIYEQIIWRRTEVRWNSPKCWFSGKCKICGCDILGKTMEDRACSIIEHPDLLEKRAPCYPAMMDAAQWNEYKKLKNIKLFN